MSRARLCVKNVRILNLQASYSCSYRVKITMRSFSRISCHGKVVGILGMKCVASQVERKGTFSFPPAPPKTLFHVVREANKRRYMCFSYLRAEWAPSFLSFCEESVKKRGRRGAVSVHLCSWCYVWGDPPWYPGGKAAQLWLMSQGQGGASPGYMMSLRCSYNNVWLYYLLPYIRLMFGLSPSRKDLSINNQN